MTSTEMTARDARRTTGHHRRGIVVWASVIAGLGGFLFGYDTGIVSAALLYVAPEYHLGEFGQQFFVAILLAGAVIGVMGGGPVVDRLGRRRTLILLAAIYIVGALGSSLIGWLPLIYVSRFLLGLSVGSSSLVVPMYIAEIAPARIRGRLVSFNQLFVALGIFVSYLVGYAFAPIEGWRWMIGLAAVPAVVMLVGLLPLPESPRWLAAKGRVDDARAVLERIRSTVAEAAAELGDITSAIKSEHAVSYRSLFRTRGVRRGIVIGVVVAATNQLSGVNAILYYAPTMLKSAGFGDSSAILSSVGIGGAFLLFTLIGLLLVDFLGRRWLLIGGTLIVAIALAAIGALYLFPQSSTVGVLLVIGLMIYEGVFAASLGIAIWLVNSEVLPNRVRGKAQSFGTVTHWGLDLIISLVVLSVISGLSATTLFWAFAVFAIAGTITMWKILPETKGRSLEDIERQLEEA
ncbi:sugar porter family MFS transporter [Curtobacterium sp. MCBD17_003]|uniref:sugar porter family MFS transporter n=1 Tax=Curtobacterium sp. MCBD17_003 TaxID=2175667 RepID=UPI001C65248A|nr:sugar porter family MFS transporter [Curtobacterium sp. MCBD17_003]WIE55301.1 sugar porter family MFS transporter [Curtobacterium sp. MCBD17_003]